MGGATSPVNAPWSSQWQFWAPNSIFIRSDSMIVWIDRRSVNGGCTVTTTLSWSSPSSR